MPGISLRLSGEADSYAVSHLAAELTTLTCRILDKSPGDTAVMIEFVRRELWFIDGRSLQELDRDAFRLEVTITDETCSKTQKARYHREAFDLLRKSIDKLHPHSNVHIIDCRASGYGYGGVTQEYRYQHERA